MLDPRIHNITIKAVHWKEISKQITQDMKAQIYQYEEKPYQHEQHTNMTTCFPDVQDKMTSTLHKIQQQSSKDCYMIDFKNVYRRHFIQIQFMTFNN